MHINKVIEFAILVECGKRTNKIIKPDSQCHRKRNRKTLK